MFTNLVVNFEFGIVLKNFAKFHVITGIIISVPIFAICWKYQWFNHSRWRIQSSF